MLRRYQPDPAMDEHAILTARAALEWRCRQANSPLPRLPEAAVLTHQGSLIGPRRPWSRRRGNQCLSFEVREMTAYGQSIAVACCRGVGAAATAVVLEEMAVAGVKRVLALDIAGSLDASVASGTCLVVEAALATDGTSPHYTGEAVVRPDASLTQRLADTLERQKVAYSRGIVWSTDAVFRETPSGIGAARGQGAVAADMETAAVLAVCAALGMEAAGVLVVADELYDGWRPPADLAVIQRRLKQVLSLAPACLLP